MAGVARDGSCINKHQQLDTQSYFSRLTKASALFIPRVVEH